MFRYGAKFAEGVVEGLVDVLNYELANEGATTFDLSFKGMPFNLTMTKAPVFSNADNRITLHIAGEFVSDDMGEYVPSTDVWTDYSMESDNQVDQIWIHQSTINSLLYDLSVPLSGEGFEMQIFSLLSELRAYYGPETTCSGEVSFPKEKNSQPVTMTAADGIIVGDSSTGGLRLNLDIYCAKDANTPKELSVTLDTGLHLLVYFLWDNFVITARMTEAAMMQTVATSYIGDLDYHNWDAQLTAVVKGITDDVTLRFGEGIDLKEKSIVKFVAGIARKTLLSPFIQDEFLFAGWKMITDRQ